MARGSADRLRRTALAALVVAAAGGSWIAAGAWPAADRTPCETEETWAPLLEAHLTRYPEMEIADAYKLLHQAVLGSEHAVTSRVAAAAWLSDEMSGLGDGREEPLVDPLGTEARVVRIHLRPFRARGGFVGRLAGAFFETASLVEADPAELGCALEALTSPPRASDRPWRPEEARVYVDARRAAGFPAVHHSEAYQEAYRPAYRVVATELIEDAIRGVRR